MEDGVIKNLGVTDAAITGNDYTGVLAGQTRGSATLIDGCFVSGSVSGNDFVGGLVGYNLLRATIQNCGSRASVSGEEYVGGLAGANLETINNCYATGSVSATIGGGGLSDGNPVVTNSFWDTETSGLASSEGGTGKTSSEMKDIATFTNTATGGLTTAWDFVGTTNNDAATDDWWNMNLISTKTDNDGYPMPSWWVVTDEPSGDGSSGTPYQIATLNNLYWLSEGGGTAIWDDDKYFEQTADIAAKSTAYINKGAGFTSIGNSTTKFTGFYDGQSNEIDYLFINRPDQNYVGLFGYIANGGLSNLGLTNVNVTGGDDFTGMLVGYLRSDANEVEISNCSTSGSVAGGNGVGNTGDPTWVTGETTTNMKTQSTFTNAGWDFTTIWAMDGTTNNGYAYLQNNTPPGTILSWTGNSSSDWNTPGNWSGNFVPSGSNDVNIPNTTNQPEIASDMQASCKNLSVENDASLNILSNASGTGSLIVSGTASGDINVQRYLDVNDKASKWHYVSAPVSGQLINDGFMTDNSIYSPNGGTNYNFYRWDEDTDYWIIYGSTGNPEAFGDGSFAAGRGYAMSRSSSGVVNFEGSIRTADVSYSASYTAGKGQGWNMVGNPFTSALAVTSDATTDDKFLTNASNTSLITTPLTGSIKQSVNLQSPSGFYIVRIHSENKMISKKVIIE